MASMGKNSLYMLQSSFKGFKEYVQVLSFKFPGSLGPNHYSVFARQDALFWLKIINWKNINEVVLVIAKIITKINFGGLELPGGD